jgi:hypothetical protein
VQPRFKEVIVSKLESRARKGSTLYKLYNFNKYKIYYIKVLYITYISYILSTIKVNT